MSKTAQSGLRTLKRDFSEGSASSQEIYWPPTPQQQPPKHPDRLKAIQDALAEISAPPSRPTALVDSRTVNKRPSPETDAVIATKKPRQLPPGWRENDSLSAPSLSSRSRSSSSWNNTDSKRTVNPSLPSVPPLSSSSTLPAAKPKISPVFLSQEQTQILQLVKDGHSIFYTGSAGTGKSVLLREIIKTLRRKNVKSPDAVAITASTGS
ncbi:hypothetical protein L208DRAFT_1296450 [Tricholoma matsutake]|nr:hypothetical protein L208DRAFT_1296450 [Tricholoma matsutake 945]